MLQNIWIYDWVSCFKMILKRYFIRKPRYRKIGWILFILVAPTMVHGQVEHNFPVGPEATNCDSLNVATTNTSDAIHMIENTTFRFQQQFRISRSTGVMGGRFFSCDGLMGFLIMRVDKKDLIYLKVPRKKWDDLVGSGNMDVYYESEIRDQYVVLEDD